MAHETVGNALTQTDEWNDPLQEFEAMFAADPALAAIFEDVTGTPYIPPPPALKPKREIDAILREAIEHRESKKSGKTAVITKKQIQALTKEHLLLIILDQDFEIQQLREDIDKITEAYQAGREQRRME